MDREYYRQYFRFEREHWWFKVRNKILMEQAQRVLKKSAIHQPQILNIGAATGKTTQDLSLLGEVTTLEYDKECCDFLKEQLDIDAINGSVLELPFENDRFDLVCAFDVIEHVEDDVKAVGELYRVCKPGGCVLVAVPMYQFLWSSHDEINHHFRRYTMKSLIELFTWLQEGMLLRKSYFNSLLFLPVLIFRFIDSLKKRKASASDFEQGNYIIDKVFFWVFRLEIICLRGFSFPFGVSGFLAWKKSNQ